MTTYKDHPLLYLVVSAFEYFHYAGKKVRWSDNDVHLYSPDSSPSTEYYPVKRDGNISPPILKYSKSKST